MHFQRSKFFRWFARQVRVPKNANRRFNIAVGIAVILSLVFMAKLLSLVFH